MASVQGDAGELFPSQPDVAAVDPPIVEGPAETPADPSTFRSRLAERWALRQSETTPWTIKDTAVIAGGIVIASVVAEVLHEHVIPGHWPIGG